MKQQLENGFTLVEIMIVVLIIGILATLAVPNFKKARKTTWRNICIDNLRAIEGACEQIWMAGDTPTAEKLYGPDNFMKVEPHCPANPANRYQIPEQGARPVCPNADDYPDHKLKSDDNDDLHVQQGPLIAP